MAFSVADVIANPLFIYPLFAIVIVVLLYLLFARGRSKVKLISMNKMIEDRMKETLLQNRSAQMLLRQQNKIIGITSNYGAYQIDGKTLYFFLYTPKFFYMIPKFWARSRVLGIADDLKKEIKETSIGLWKFKMRKVMNFVLHDNYFIDNYSGMWMSMADKTMFKFVQNRRAILRDEVKGSIGIAQDLRLTAVNPDEPFTDKSAIIPSTEEQVKT